MAASRGDEPANIQGNKITRSVEEQKVSRSICSVQGNRLLVTAHFGNPAP
jgi:hypothetical protein